MHDEIDQRSCREGTFLGLLSFFKAERSCQNVLQPRSFMQTLAFLCNFLYRSVQIFLINVESKVTPEHRWTRDRHVLGWSELIKRNAIHGMMIEKRANHSIPRTQSVLVIKHPRNLSFWQNFPTVLKGKKTFSEHKIISTTKKYSVSF